MHRITRIVVLAFVASLVLGVAAPVLATEAPPEETTETTLAPVPNAGADEPAVVVPPADADEAEQPWTARFVYPLLGVLTVLIIGGYAIGYNRTIRRRYEVVA
ncbi:MAG: hypothetical protein M5U23_02625 [Acidimicrobiia bacterium]|nr:hypothetical protein [Acidimicrobiia bacterium]